MVRTSLFAAAATWACASLSGVASAAPVEHATSSPEDDLQKARRAYESAQSLMARGDYAGAAKELETAVKIRETGGLYFHLGNCYAQIGRLVDAKKAFESASRVLKERPQKDVEDALPGALATLAARLPTVEITGSVEGTRVYVDDVLVELAGRLLVDPGQRRLRFEADGYEPYEETVLAKEGGSLQVRPRMKRVEPRSSNIMSTDASATPTASPAAGWTTSRHIVFWSSTAVFAAGAGLFTIGIVNGGSASSRASAANKELDQLLGSSTSGCASPSSALAQSCADLKSANDDQASAQMLTIVGGAALGVGVVGAIASAFFWPEEDLKVGASAGPGFASVSLRKAF